MRIRIEGCTSVTNLDGLAGADLTDLRLMGSPVEDIGPLVTLMRLEQLDLDDTKVTDLSALARLPALKMVDVCNRPGLDVSPLAHPTRWLELRINRVQDVRGLELLGRSVRIRRF